MPDQSVPFEPAAEPSPLEQKALDLMEQEHWEEAICVWEAYIVSDDSGLSPYAPYAMCLAQLGRVEDANKICDAMQTAINQLPEDERRAQLQILLDAVTNHLGVLEPLMIASDLDDLYGEQPEKKLQTG